MIHIFLYFDFIRRIHRRNVDSLFESDYNKNIQTVIELKKKLPQIVQKLNDMIIKKNSTLIDYKNLEIGELIGQGHFGQVRRAVLVRGDEREDVALKSLKMDRSQSDEEMIKFVEEGLLLGNSTKHNNILNIIGFSFDNSMPVIVMPLMPNKDINTYIKAHEDITNEQLIQFAIDIANGMKYLSEHKFVHRDIASRNCVLTDELIAKLADFGLARDIEDKDYYRTDITKGALPMKWMAPEYIETGKATVWSDIWAYGVFVWEMFSRCEKPYESLENDPVLLLDHLKKYRLPKPELCPNKLYKILLKCWSSEPKNRPVFKELVKHMKEILKTIQNERQNKI